nr:hypothetical protein [Tanacetum cinerariifolium]
MSAKRTSWNVFSSVMASIVICLSTGDDIAAHGEVPTVLQEPSIPSPTLHTPAPQPPQDLPLTSQRVDTSEDTMMDDVSNQWRIIDELDKYDVVSLMDDKEEDKKEEVAKAVENDQVQGRQAESQAKIYKIDMDHDSKVLSMQENEPTEMQKNIVGLRLDYFKGMSYDNIRLIVEAMFNSNVDFLLNTKEQMEKEESRALQSINETPAQKVAKRRKLNKEVEDLKRYLEIVPDKDDDVYTEMLPLMEKSMILMQRRLSLKSFFLQAVVLNQGNKMIRPRNRLKERRPVESFIANKDLNAEFEDCSDNSSNEVNAAASIVLTVRQNSLNNTNTFSVVGPSNVVVSPIYGKSSFIDASQLPNDRDMPELEDITYSDDEDVVGTEANFNNLETSITISPIPTTRIHKDHIVSQIIGDLSSTTQIRSIKRVVKDQGVLLQMFDNDFHTSEILRNFRLTEGKSTSTPIDTEKPLLKDLDGEDVDVHTYRSMIGSLMYFTSSRLDIMFAVGCTKWNEVIKKDVTTQQMVLDTKLVIGNVKATNGSEKAKEGSSKRAAGNLEQEDAKRQRIDEENESAKLKRCLEIIFDDDNDVTIEATPLSSKSLTIIDYKIYK